MTGHCPWCLTVTSPSSFPCCVPAFFWQIAVQESAPQILTERGDYIGFLDLKHHPFVPPDNPPDEEQPP